MKNRPIPDPVTEWQAETERHHKAFVAFMQRWPSSAMKAAFADLGAAIAVVDCLGGDVEGFLRELREREPRPDFKLVPNPKVRS